MSNGSTSIAVEQPDRVNPLAVASMAFAHALALLAFLVPFKWWYVALAIGTYYGRMLFISIGYHRYFSHRSFQTSRVFQFILAFGAQLSAQKGALWWAAHHRHHHLHSDDPKDVHSPRRRGLIWAHIGWLVCPKYDPTRTELIKDFARYPELRWLNEWWWVPSLLGVGVLYAIGGFPIVVWGGFVSTALLFQGTFTVNSLAHVFGKRRYLTTDTSRNNWWLAAISLGDGWHNNHHFHQNSARHGFFWWELDFSYYTLRLLELFGVVWKLKTPEHQTRYAHLKYTDAQREELKREPVMPEAMPIPAAVSAPGPVPVAPPL